MRRVIISCTHTDKLETMINGQLESPSHLMVASLRPTLAVPTTIPSAWLSTKRLRNHTPLPN